jgi:hypothetical protein
MSLRALDGSGRIILPSRPDPYSHPGNYQSYRITFGSDVKLKGACELVRCEAWQFGWTTTVDEATELGGQQANYIRHLSGRDFKEQRTEAGLTVFTFSPHQRCFAEHTTTPNFFLVRAGDYRQNLGLIRQHTNGRDWAEDMGEHMQNLADEHTKGSI